MSWPEPPLERQASSRLRGRKGYRIKGLQQDEQIMHPAQRRECRDSSSPMRRPVAPVPRRQQARRMLPGAGAIVARAAAKSCSREVTMYCATVRACQMPAGHAAWLVEGEQR